MRQTDSPPTSAGGKLLTRVAELAGVLSLIVAIVIVASGDARLARATAVGLAMSLIAIGVAQLTCASHRGRHGRLPRASRNAVRGFGRLCFGAGLLQLGSSLLLPPLASALSGAAVGLALTCVGVTQPGFGSASRRARAGTPVLAVVVLVLLTSASLALGGILTVQDDPPITQEPEQEGTDAEPPPGSESEPDPLPTYAELCRSLPDPIAIGHGLGELFQRDDAIKAGCGTHAFRVPGTGMWVAAGMCLGERRSVATSFPEPEIIYGEAAEFIWEAAQDGELATVEAAAPGGGDVVLVGTRTGVYAFARSTRSATPGNEDARACNEVAGVAEPFARLPPPLLALWRELVRDSATWFWPTVDGADESVAFLSTGEVVQGRCDSNTLCHLEVEGRERTLTGSAFVVLDELREYMPAEEEP